MSAKYKSPSFLLPNELNTSANTANDTGINSLYSMDFDGSSYINAGSASYLNSLSQFSISVWFNLTTAESNKCIVSDWNYNTSPLGHFALQTQDASGSNYALLLFIKATSDAGVNNVKTSAILTENTWHHAVFTYNSGTVTCYIDGSSVSLTTNGTIPTTLTNQDGNLLIGDFAGLSRFWNGKIDEVAIFNKALNTTEIAALYDGTGSNIRPSNLIASNLNPIAYYPLGEQAQNTGKLPEATANVWQFPNGVLQDYVMDFDNTSPGDYISTPMTMLNSATQCTISFWGKKDASNNSLNVASQEGAGIGGIWINWHSDGNVYFSPRGPGNTSFSIIYSQSYDNNWHHYLGVYDGSSAANCKLYLDGNLVATGSGTAPSSLSSNAGNKFKIGAMLVENFYTNGQISNVAVWNTAITDANQIANIYNNGSPQTTYTVTPQNWWKLNADSVYTPSAPNYTTALDFNGTSDFIDITQSSTLPPNSGDFTYSCWVNIDANIGVSIIVLLNKGDAWPGNGILIRYRSYFEVIINGVTYDFNSTSLVDSPGVWRHFALVFDETANTLTAYVDTTKQVLSATTTLNVSDANFIIGKRQTNIQYFKGKMSNLAVYSSALTDSQISTLFNFGTPETTPSFSPAAWWKLDNTTTGIQDSSGNGNNGTNNGTTQLNSSVAFVPSWKISSALTIPTVNYTSALEFNQPSANNEYVDIGNITYLNQAGDFSISQWVFSSSTKPYSYNGMSIKLGNGFLYLANQSGVGLRWEYEFRGGSRQNVTTGVAVPEDRWIHIALTVEGTVSKFYQDGDLKHTGTVGTTYSGNPSKIGQEYNSNYAWNGKISNTALFNSALSPSNVNTLYNNGQPEATPSFSPLHWWKLDNTSTGLNDVGSAASNNGTLVQTSAPGAEEVATNVYIGSIPVNGVSTTLPSTALQQSNLQFDSPYSNYSLKFSTSQSIDTNFTLPASYTTYSYSFWYRSTAASIGTGDYYIISNFDSSNTNLSGTRGAVRFNNSTKMRIFGGDNTNYYSREYEVGSSLLDQQWHNVVVTFTNTEVLLYIDGVSISVGTTTNTPITGFAANRSYTIGQSGINSGYLINSKLDEFAIFNKKLTEAEILSIYNNGKPNDISPIAPTNWWRLGENAYFVNNNITLPNSVSGAPNGVSSGTVTSMLSADAPGTYANGIGANLDIVDRVGDAPLSTANSQSYNMIPDDKIPYVPGYVGTQTTNEYEMTFDGIDDYFDLGTYTQGTGLALNADMSISAWIKTSNLSSTQVIICNLTSNAGSGGYCIEMNRQANGQYGILYDGATVGLQGSTILSSNTWYHIVMTRTGTSGNWSYNLYLNGSSDGSATNVGQNFGNGSVAIGRFGAYNGGYFNGQIDEVAIFDTALTADQVKFDLYEPTATGTNQTADIANNPNLPTPVAWYRMGD